MSRAGGIPFGLITDDSSIGGQVIDGSTRFNQLYNQYLYYTPSSDGNRYKCTISLWCRRSKADYNSALAGVYVSNSDRAVLRFFSDGRINFQYSGANATTNAYLRDYKSWYHIVVAMDTTLASQSDRVKIYVNGHLQTLSVQGFTQNLETRWTDNVRHLIGARVSGSSVDSPDSYYDGYIAQYYLIDNQQLAPTDFGFFDDLTGIWKPKKYTGTFNTHSYHLPLDGNSLLQHDASGNNNHWTPIRMQGYPLAKCGTTDCLPIMETNSGGTNALYKTREDPYAANLELAMPMQDIRDVSHLIKGSGSPKSTTAGGTDSYVMWPNLYGSHQNFNGSGDKITVGSDSAFALGTGDFTIELNFRKSNTNSSEYLFDFGTNQLSMYFLSNNTLYYYANVGGSNTGNVEIGSVAEDQWCHVAVVRKSGVVKIFLNGTLRHTRNEPRNWSSAQSVTIGQYGGGGSYSFEGFMSDFRIYKGIAKYETDFKVAAVDSSIVPESPAGVAVPRRTDIASSTNGSVTFDGDSDYLHFGSHADHAFGTGDYTVECFLYTDNFMPDYRNKYQNFIATRGAGGTTAGWTFSIEDNRTVGWYSNGHQFTASGEIHPNTWTHIAVTRSGTDIRLFINGRIVTSGSCNDNYTNTTLTVGHNNDGSGDGWYRGMISNLRIIKGTALYTSSFNPPDSPLTNVTNTKIIACTSNSDPLATVVTTNNPTKAGGTYAHIFNPFDSVDVTNEPDNYATLNSGDVTSNVNSVDNAGMIWRGNSNNNRTTGSNIWIRPGMKVYWEVQPNPYGTGSATCYTGVVQGRTAESQTTTHIGGNSTSWGWDIENNGRWRNSNSNQYTTIGSDRIGMTQMYCMMITDSGAAKIWIGKDGIWYRGGQPHKNINPTSTNFDQDDIRNFIVPVMMAYNASIQFNSGIKPFQYPIPEGFTALSTSNVAKPTMTVMRPKRHMDCITYTGTGSTNHHITGLEFKPDFVWIKCRTQQYTHLLYDSVRGPGKQIYSDADSVEYTNLNNLYSFNEDGFSLAQSGNDDVTNKSGDNFIAWCWKGGGAAVTNNDGSNATTISANPEAGFSVVKWTGTGSDASLGHGLGRKPRAILVKNLSQTDSWRVWWRGVTNNDSEAGILSSGNAFYSGSDKWNNSGNSNNTTETTFGVSNDGSTNRSGQNFIAYCWAEVPGYSRIGTYQSSGEGGVQGPYVYCGFRPRYVFIKNTVQGGEEWVAYDSARDMENPVSKTAYVGENYIEYEGTSATGGNSRHVDFMGNGFRFNDVSNPMNKPGSRGNVHLFMAFADMPESTPFGAYSNAL